MSMVAGVGSDAVLAQTLSLRQSVPHITTSGSASADVVPDEAIIQLGIMTESATAPVASAGTAKAATAVIAEIKAQGIPDRDIRTTSVNLTTLYDDDHDQAGRVTKHTLRGYQSSESLSILIRDVTKAGRLAQSLIDKGANEFGGISFYYSKEREKRRELQADAMRDALAEAQSYTGAIGLKLGRVIQIGVDPDGDNGSAADMPSRRMPASLGKTISTVAIPIEPGVQTISASITVTWEIENGS